jgi:hypothetical protein
MDIDKLYTFATSTFSDYFHVLVGTLTGRGLAFSPPKHSEPEAAVVVPTEPGRALSVSSTTQRLHPQLFGYVVVSVFIGVAMDSLRIRKFEMTTVLAVAAFLTVSWLVYSSFTFLVCKLLGGTGSYVATISMMVQLLATVFVVSGFVSLGMSAVAFALITIANFSSPVLKAVSSESSWAYYMVHVLLLMVYVPIVLRPIHRFGVVRSLLLAVIPPIAAVFGLALALSNVRFGS